MTVNLLFGIDTSMFLKLFFDAPFKSYIIISPIIALFVAALVLRLKK